jgi:hypothetical protein
MYSSSNNGQQSHSNLNGSPKRPLTQRDLDELHGRIAALRAQLANNLASDLTENPQLADSLVKQVDDMLAAVVREDAEAPLQPDRGLAELVGLGPTAASDLGQTWMPSGVEPYDETITSERILAIADLYYLYQHERIGVFRAIRKLQELFRAGTVQLASGSGAYALYQFDRREVLRYTNRDRMAAYRRAFGYGGGQLVPGARSNTDFHPMYSHFINQVALFWRDKRISDVIRERSFDPSFGSIAVVRRAGLDLRNNLKWMSFGHLSVLRVEVMQLLDEAFKIMGAKDIRGLFGADTAWDVVEEMLVRHLNERPLTSPRQRMAIAGREVLRWLGQSHILQTSRSQFEALLLEIAEYSEEWLTSAQAMGIAQRRSEGRVLSVERAPLTTAGSTPRAPRRRPRTAAGGVGSRRTRESEQELEV